MPLSRRRFLAITGAVAAATALSEREVAAALSEAGRGGVATGGSAPGPGGPGRARHAASSTTLAERLVAGPKTNELGFRRVATTDGEPHGLDDELAAPGARREQRRRSLGCVVHLTDQHIVDAEAPARVEFLARYGDEECGDPASLSSAWRPHEAAGPRLTDAMNRRARDIGFSPVTGVPITAAVCTGDNHDNQMANELDTHLAAMNGARVWPSSGDPSRYEGVQASGDVHYWHPAEAVRDTFKTRFGFPAADGWLERVLADFAAVGVGVPWYSCYGNHDGLAQGNSPALPAYEMFNRGSAKPVGPPPGTNPCSGLSELGQLPHAPAMTVTRDDGRTYADRREWIRAHLESGGEPRGHGFTAANVTTNRAYYTADVAGLRWIVLDTVNPGGEASGSIGKRQLEWLERQLRTARAERRLVVVFSHHGLRSLDNPNQAPNPLAGADGNDLPRFTAEVVRDVVSRFRCVVAWVNGHTHSNVIEPQPGPFWDIGTAAHIDWPGQARLVEVVDNRDGTLSVFTTMFDHAEPDSDVRLARELSGNDYRKGGFGAPQREGRRQDRNMELILPHPYDPDGTGRWEPPTPTANREAPGRHPLDVLGGGDDARGGEGFAPLTLGGALAVAGAGGLARLRQRASVLRPDAAEIARDSEPS